MTGEWKPGGTPGDVDRAWSAARERGRNGRTVAIAAALVAAVLVVAVVLAVTRGGGETPPGSAPGTSAPVTAALPADGDYRITVAHTGLCLGAGEQPEHDRYVMMQADCPAAVPKLSLRKGEGTYRILMDYPEIPWVACLSLDGEEPGYLYGPQDCVDGDFARDFTLEPAAEGTFRIRSPGGMCMDAYEGGDRPGTLFAAADCSPDSASQRYRFERL